MRRSCNDARRSCNLAISVVKRANSMWHLAISAKCSRLRTVSQVLGAAWEEEDAAPVGAAGSASGPSKVIWESMEGVRGEAMRDSFGLAAKGAKGRTSATALYSGGSKGGGNRLGSVGPYVGGKLAGIGGTGEQVRRTTASIKTKKATTNGRWNGW